MPPFSSIHKDNDGHAHLPRKELGPDLGSERSFRVVVVDPHDADRARICRLLSADKAVEVHEAASVDGLMSLLAEGEFDCVMLDDIIGTDAVFAISEKLRAEHPNPPAVIMLTGEGNEQIAVTTFRRGFSDYLKKESVTTSELSLSIARAVGLRRADEDLKARIEYLSSLAMRDSLTGLLSRSSLEDRLSMVRESGVRHKKAFAIILLVINQFKKINDGFGRTVGDRALKAFANHLREAARGSEMFGRFGGHEFLYIIESDVSIEGTRSACRRLLGALSFSIDLEDTGLSIQPCIGAAIYPIDGKTTDQLLDAADQAMQEAKRSGSGYLLACDRKTPEGAASRVAASTVIGPGPLPSSAAGIDGPHLWVDSDPPAVENQSTSAALTETDVDLPQPGEAATGDFGAPAPETVHHISNHRAKHRHRVLKRGRIISEDGFSSADCIIRDLSEQGAWIELASAATPVPRRFTLMIVETGAKLPAEKKWQKGEKLGLMFPGGIHHPALTEDMKRGHEDSSAGVESEPGSAREPDLRRAFVIDDEPQVTAYISKALDRSGFTTTSLARLSEVEAALALVKPELIVLDLSLGESDAVEVLHSIANTQFDGHILLISGHDLPTLEQVRQIGERHGLAMLPVLHKPFRLHELTAIVAQMASSASVKTAANLLDTALRNGWLELWYEPKIALRSMRIGGAEAVIRLRHPDEGVLLPEAFLPPPGSPPCQPLYDFVVQRALADWRSIAASKSGAGGPSTTRLAINVPASILRTREFIASVLRHRPRHPEFPGLIVEIAEDEVISDPVLAQEIAVRLRLYNIHMSINGFGSNYSTLERLAQLPFAELKLDRGFVAGCSVDQRKSAICQKVVDLAHRNKMIAVAEGVETVDDLQTLIRMGCDMAQGSLLAKPMPYEEFVQMPASDIRVA